jgi:hypothetical protein
MSAHGRERAQYYSWDRVSQQVLSYNERLNYERDIIERTRDADSTAPPITRVASP